MPRKQDMLDFDSDEGLPMAGKAAVVLAAAELLDIGLDRRMIDNIADDATADDQRLPDLRIAAVGVEKDARELDASATSASR